MIRNQFIQLILALFILTAPATALDNTQTVYQQSQNNSTTGPDFGVTVVSQNQTDCVETIDEYTRLCHSSVTDSGRLTLVLYSERYQKVQLTDSGKFLAGGNVPIREFDLNKGRNEIEWQITVRDGFMGIAIGTPETLYSEPLRPPNDSKGLLPGKPTTTDAAIAGSTVFVLFAAGLPLSFLALRKMKGGEHDQH
ncbi:hypothetical protein [Haladaptatus cibarius]|uniref:hypothetical protein n=1 Tax=Haladaptatus cibarius TaxID=453847 RepID=UPI0006786229|nr:hypothetical protein [Haladaptatus cibarius]